MSLASFCHTPKSFARLPLPHQEVILSVMTSTSMVLFEEPSESKQQLWSGLNKAGIRFPPGVFENLKSNDSIEMWTSELQFVFAMGPLLKKVTYTLEELAENPWQELFSRPQSETLKLLAGLPRALETQESQLNVTSWHPVTETKSAGRSSLDIKVRQISPFQSTKGFSGAVAIIESRRPKPLI